MNAFPTKVAAWAPESEVQHWLSERLRETGVFSHVITEMRLVDVFGNPARADIGLVGEIADQSFLIAIELKARAFRSARAADGFAQAYHYREMCVVRDARIPEAFQRKSPNLGFAGLFAGADELDPLGRVAGMEILAPKLRVGGVYLQSFTPGGDVVLRVSTADLFRTNARADGNHWHRAAPDYLFGSVKRNVSRKQNVTLAERVLNLYPNADLFGESTL